MSTAYAPAQLSLAPRPLPEELLSSWLLRTAAANGISLRELLDGVRFRHPESLSDCHLIDYAVPDATLRTLSHFTRVPVTTLRKLDLSVRAPGLNSALLFRCHHRFCGCPRVCSSRLGYAFCPPCLAERKIVYIRWDWCFTALGRCAVHRTSLLDTCANCEIPDPLDFSPALSPPPFLCRSCHAGLAHPFDEARHSLDQDAIIAVETAYRLTLLKPASYPKLLGTVADRAFRRFVDDLLEMLLVVFSARSGISNLLVPRNILLQTIAELARTAAPIAERRERDARYRRSGALWLALFQVLTPDQGQTLERFSQHWPRPLRQRFTSALHRRRRERWPYGPFTPSTLSPRFKYNTLAAVLDLSTMPRPADSKFRI